MALTFESVDVTGKFVYYDSNLGKRVLLSTPPTDEQLNTRNYLGQDQTTGRHRFEDYNTGGLVTASQFQNVASPTKREQLLRSAALKAAAPIISALNPQQITDGATSLVTTQIDNLRKAATSFPGADEFQGAFTALRASSDDAALAGVERHAALQENEYGINNGITNVISGPSDPGAVSTNSTTARKFNPIPNVLHNFTTYTYSLSLHAMKIDQYNELMTNGLSTYRSENVLIASAGRHGADTGLTRHRIWKNDFYFDKMTLESVVGTNNKGRGSNVLTVDFTVVEPYGITLLDRLSLTADELGYNNPTEMIYLLQIDFFGYDDENLNPTKIDKTQRRIPIKIIRVEAGYNHNGATYNITGIVVSHSAFDESNINIQTPARLGNGKNLNLESFIGSNAGEIERLSKELLKHHDARKRYKDSKLITDGSPPVPLKIGVRIPTLGDAGLGSILNAYWIWAKDEFKYEEIPYIFNILLQDSADKTVKMKNITVSSKQLHNLRNKAGSIEADKVLAAKEQAAAGSNPTVEGQNISFPIGTSIIDIINDLLKISDYFLKQTVESETDDTKEQDNRQGKRSSGNLTPLNFFKITPSITFGPFIKKMNAYQKKITIGITPFKYYGNRLPFGGQGAPKKSDCIKEYNYLFTGKNIDVIDLKIDFNTAFYSFLTAGAYSDSESDRALGAGARPRGKKEAAGVDRTSELAGKQLLVPSSKGAIDPTQADQQSLRVNDLFNNIYSSSKADMLAIDMKILGDPSYIQEQEALFDFLLERTQRAEDPRLFKSGSLVVNDGDLLVNVNFRLANDINTTTGLHTFADDDIGIKGRYFSGIYKVLTIKSEFSKGVFTQDLSMVRAYNDEESKAAGKVKPSPRDSIISMADLEAPTANSSTLTAGLGAIDTAEYDGLTDPLSTVTSGVLTSVNSTIAGLQAQAVDDLNAVTNNATLQATSLLNADRTLAAAGLSGAGILNSTEDLLIKQVRSRNDGLFIDDGDTG